LLGEEALSEVQSAMERVTHAVGSTDPSVIEAAIKALADVTEPFAAMRMNRGISKALAGKSIESI